MKRPLYLAHTERKIERGREEGRGWKRMEGREREEGREGERQREKKKSSVRVLFTFIMFFPVV